MKIPQIRVCVTDECDKKCFYCRPGGEAYPYQEREKGLTDEEFLYLIKAIVEAGVSVVRFTGGEPMLNKDIYKLIKAVKNLKNVKNVSMVTRSLRLEQEAALLKDSGLDSITISIDSLNRDKLKWITKVDCLEVLKNGAWACNRVKLPMKINTVILKDINNDEIEDFIEFAEELEADLKLLDYIVLPEKFEWNSDKNYFFDLRLILPKIRSLALNENNEFSRQAGGLGIPMPTFLMPSGIRVYVKNSTIGNHYSPECKKCNFFPCQDGIMALRLTADAKLQMCLYRKDNLIDLKPYLCKKSEKQLNKLIKKALDTFRFSEFHPGLWKPIGGSEVNLINVRDKNVRKQKEHQQWNSSNLNGLKKEIGWGW